MSKARLVITAVIAGKQPVSEVARSYGVATGELLRQLTLDPTRNYQPTGKPTPSKTRTP